MRARCRVGKAVTSWPKNSTRPASGARPPHICAIRVDLPAPLGPITAWISPGFSDSEISREACTAPKLLVMPWVARTGSVMRHLPSGQKPDDPTAGEQHHAQQKRAKVDVPEL